MRAAGGVLACTAALGALSGARAFVAPLSAPTAALQSRSARQELGSSLSHRSGGGGWKHAQAVQPLRMADKDKDGGDFRQILGLKGASESSDILRIRVQLMKPVTWIPLIWGVICGAGG
jgi:hypothetical protein